MKRSLGTVVVVLVAVFLAGASFADNATKEECVAKSKEAAKRIHENGLDGKMLAHPMSPALVGRNMLDHTDKADKGKYLFKEFVAVAKTKGEGWVDYMWPKPGEQAPSKKISYIYRVPGKDLLVGAGIYE